MAAPSTAILDNFNRANAANLGAAWTAGLYSGTPSLNITSNRATPAGADFRDNYWNAGTFGPDSEAYVTTAVIPATAGEYAYMWIRGQSPGTAGGDAYQLIIEGTVTDTNHIWALQRVINESGTTLDTRTQTIADGDAIGFNATGAGATVTLQIWHKPAAGAWTQLGADITDTDGSRIVAAGYIGLGGYGALTAFDDFGGGTLSAAAGIIPFNARRTRQAFIVDAWR